MSDCGVGEEGGAEVGTVEGERGSWRQITSQRCRQKQSPLSPLDSLSLPLVSSCLRHVQNLVSKSFCCDFFFLFSGWLKLQEPRNLGL